MTSRGAGPGVGERLRAFARDRRGWMFAVPAAAFGALVIVAALNLDRGSARPERPSRIDGAAELLPPSAVTPEELARASGARPDQTSISLAAGAWVQVADETGRLAQQYSATKLDPLPGSQIAMREPRAQIFQRDGRVLALAARKGIAFVPRRALESGTLEDDVEVRLFRPLPDGRAVDVDRDPPSVVVTADQAQFDGSLGEVRCDRAVRVATDAGTFAGEGLSLVLDGEGEGVERLEILRAIEPIRIDRAARAMAAKRAGGEQARDRAAAPGIADALGGAGGKNSEPTVAAAGAPSTGGRKPTKHPFYRLVLLGGVEVVRVKDGVTSSIKGDELTAIFSLESRGLDDLALRGGDAPPGVTGPATPDRLRASAALSILPLAFASFEGPQGAPPANARKGATDSLGDSVTVTFGGKLIMVPATDPAEQLASKDDIRFDVTGANVEVLDGRSKTRIACSRLRYDLPSEKVEVYGRDGAPLTATSSRMRLEGAALRADMKAGEARLDGPGRVAFPRRGAASSDAGEQLAISWLGGVDLAFARGGEDAALSRARFANGVRVAGRQFEMDAATLDVALNPSNPEQVDGIVADGGVQVRRLGADGALAARRIELVLGVNARGESVPVRLLARDSVEARDARQTLWSDLLTVAFRPGDANAPSGVEAGGDVDIDRVEATGGVQVLLKEGARAFADALVGEGATRRIHLTGADVALVRTNVVADNLRDLWFDEAARSARSDGPGRFRAYRDAVATGEDRAAGRIARPSPTATPTLEATWAKSLVYREPTAARGTLELTGDVQVRSKPDVQTSDAVDAQSLALELGVEPPSRDALRRTAADGSRDLASAQRSLDRFTALGGARLESRRWDSPERSGEPRVFRVTGETIEYDMRSREGRVDGAGTILVNMPVDANAAAAATAPAKGAISLGRDGASRFRWTRGMKLVRDYDDVYRMTMEGAVELLHAGSRADDTLSMRSDVLEAIVERPLGGDAVAASGVRAAPAGRDPQRGADLGGPAALLGVKGLGGVFVRTPDQDVECGAFDYSVSTGVASLDAAPGRSVAIAVKGQPAPVRAQQVVWDLRSGRIQVVKASGTAGR